MEYIISDPRRLRCQYSLLVGQAGDIPREDYGVMVHRLSDGKTARAEHIADCPAAIQRIVNALMDRQVEPEGLAGALKRLK